MNRTFANGGDYRPIYETTADLRLEEEISNQISLVWDVRPEKLPKFYAADISIASNDGGIMAFVEIKRRKTDYLRYPTYLISLHKLQDLARLSEFTKRPTILAVSWADEMRWWFVPKTVEGLDLVMGGTQRRGDPQDHEPVVLIPVEEFHLFHPRDEWWVY